MGQFLKCCPCLLGAGDSLSINFQNAHVGQSLRAASDWVYQLFWAHTQHNTCCCRSGFVHRMYHYVTKCVALVLVFGSSVI